MPFIIKRFLLPSIPCFLIFLAIAVFFYKTGMRKSWSKLRILFIIASVCVLFNSMFLLIDFFWGFEIWGHFGSGGSGLSGFIESANIMNVYFCLPIAFLILPFCIFRGYKIREIMKYVSIMITFIILELIIHIEYYVLLQLLL